MSIDWYQVAAYAECKLQYPLREEVIAKYNSFGTPYISPEVAVQGLPNTNMWNILDGLVDDASFAEVATMFLRIRGCSKCIQHWDTWRAKTDEYLTNALWYSAYKTSAQPVFS